MEKLSYREFKNRMIDFNNENGIAVKGSGPNLNGVIVFKESNWETPYSLESRSYAVSNHNKAYIPGNLGYSIFGSSLDGTDCGVRLESYMQEEKAGNGGWVVDYCYFEEA